MASQKPPLTSKEKMIKIKKGTVEIVEAMLEENISKEWFLENCLKLCQADYDDVVQERSITSLCGYPVCSRPIENVIRQQYKINRAQNKVYDLKERKNFCSNECYKASNFLKNQLHSLPLYMRKPECTSLKLKLLLDSENKGSEGEELVLHPFLSKTEIDQRLNSVAPPIATMNLKNMLQEDIKDCSQQLVGLNVKERIYKDKYVFDVNKSYEPEHLDDETLSNSQNLLYYDEDEPSIPKHENFEKVFEKLMPRRLVDKKAQMIPSESSEPPKHTANEDKLPIELIAGFFRDWFTEDTLKYLFGEKQLFSMKADHLFKTLSNSTDSKENLESVKQDYVNLCIKIDKLPDEEEEDETVETEICDTYPVKENEDKQNRLEKIASEIDSELAAAKTNLKRKLKRRPPRKEKSVSFASGTKPSKPNVPDESQTPKPLSIDPKSQNSSRKRILGGNIKNALQNISYSSGHRYSAIQREVINLVDTFSLTPTNTVLKPKQLKCVAAIIFRILTKTKLEEFNDDAEFTKFCEKALTFSHISQEEVENLVCELVSPNQVLKLPEAAM